MNKHKTIDKEIISWKILLKKIEKAIEKLSFAHKKKTGLSFELSQQPVQWIGISRRRIYPKFAC